MHYYLEAAGPGKVRVLQPSAEERQQRRTIPCLVECKESMLARHRVERERANAHAAEQRGSVDTGGGVWAFFSADELAELGWTQSDAVAPCAKSCNAQEASVKAVCRSQRSQRCHPARRARQRNKIKEAAKPALTAAAALLMLAAPCPLILRPGNTWNKRKVYPPRRLIRSTQPTQTIVW